MANMTTLQILQGIKTWVTTKLNLKQDVINDLANIRSGAQAGSTAVQPSDLSSYFNNASYDTSTHRINFYHGQNIVAYIDASPFIVDGMVDDVRIENGYLVIDFNTASGKQDINIPLTDIFNPNNYYNKTQTDGLLAQKQDVIQDLSTIRSGASAGSTAVQPSTLSNVVKDVVAESGVYDVSANNDNTKFESLSALLSSADLNTLIPTDIRKGGMSIKFVQSSDNNYVQCRYMSSSTAAADFTNVANWQGIDSKPTAGSKNLLESATVRTAIRDSLLQEDASSLVGSWVVDSTNVSFSGTGMNGTFTSNTAPSKPASSRPYFLFSGFKNGEKYRLKLKVTINSTRVSAIGFGYASSSTPSWNPNRLVDVDGSYAIVYDNMELDCIFVAVSGKTYIYMSMDSFGIGDSVTISDFGIERIAVAETFPGTRWPKVCGKDDYDYKGLSDDGKAFVYIYEIGSRVHLNAMVDSPYIMWSAVCDTIEASKLSTSNGTVFAGNGNNRTQYRWGDSSTNRGYLCIKVSKSDWSMLTQEDITAIESSIEISIRSIEDLAEDVDNRVRELENDSYNKDDFELYAMSSSGIVPSNNNIERVKLIRDGVKAGKLFSVDVADVITDVSLAVYGAAVFKNLDGAIKNTSSSVLQQLVTPWVAVDASDISVTSDGTLSVYFKKTSGYFSYTEIKAIKDNISISLIPIENIVPENTDKGSYDTLPVGEFVSTSSGLVSAASITCVPRLGITYKFILPDGINARFAYGTSYNDLTNYTNWSANGESVTIPNGNISQRLQIQKANGSNISVAEIQEHISSGTIKVLYDKKDLSIIERNYESEQFVKAMMYRFVWPDGASITAGQDVHSLATLVHVSDLHGDVKRFENAVEYAKMLGADAVIASGDNVMNTGGNGTLYMKDVITKHGYSPFLNCIGNHETKPAQTYGNTALFNSHISPYVEQGGYKADGSTAATMPYYYVDLANMNLRIITLNQFDSGCYYGEGCGGRLGQAQVTWFCNTLLSTPANYGIVIVMHANEDQIDTPETMNAWNQTVTATGGNEDTSGYCHNGLYVNAMRPIKTIVDAFIDKTALSTTYDENTQNGNTGETVTIDIDFSNVNTGVEFICYLTGHRHKDNIGYVHTATNKQLMLNVVTSNCHYPRTSDLSFAEGCDIPRGDSGVTQDAFNVYAIDRKKGIVKIARVGSSVNFEGIERRFLIAPYKD